MKRLLEEDASNQATEYERMLLGSIEMDVPPEGAAAALLDRLESAPVVAVSSRNAPLRTSTWLLLVAAFIGVFVIVLARKRHNDGVVPIVREQPSIARVSSEVPAMQMPPPPAPAQAFDRGAAARALGQVNVDECQSMTGPSGEGHVEVMFEPEGNVRWVAVDPPFDETDRGTCVAAKFAAVRIPPFQGAPIRVGKSFVLQ